jgi:hypothetical protein
MHGKSLCRLTEGRDDIGFSSLSCGWPSTTALCLANHVGSPQRREEVLFAVAALPSRPRRASHVAQPAAARFNAEFPSGKAPTTRVRRLISRRRRSRGLLVRTRRQCLLREGVVGECLLDRRSTRSAAPGQPQRGQLLDHSGRLFAGATTISSPAWIAEHRRDLSHLGQWHVAEDAAVPIARCSVARRPRERTRRL